MQLSDLFELISYDLVIEVLGLLFAIGLIWGVFFGEGFTPFVELLIEYIC